MDTVEFLQTTQGDKEDSDYILGTVESIVDNKVKIKLDSEEKATEKSYMVLNSYHPQMGDRVLILKLQGTYIIIGSCNVAQSSEDNTIIIDNISVDNISKNKQDYITINSNVKFQGEAMFNNSVIGIDRIKTSSGGRLYFTNDGTSLGYSVNGSSWKWLQTR